MDKDIFLDGILSSSDADLVSFPINPVAKTTLDFGGAEALAFLFNVGGTALASTLTSNPNALSFVGPAIEKIGFFGWEGVKAAYKRSKEKDVKGWQQFVAGVRGGLGNLITDIAIHDPLYILMMQYGLRNSEIPAAVISAVSFLAAVPIAGLAQHYSGETAHQLLKQTSKLQKFKWEKYYESRFFLGRGTKPQEIFHGLSSTFNLPNSIDSEYKDNYHPNKLPCFSDRKVVTRSREIIESAQDSFKNLEIVFTLARKRTPSRYSEFNYFYIRKEKARGSLDRRIPFPFNKLISTQTVRGNIQFKRKVKYGNELRIALDTIEHSNNPFYIMELKVYKDLDMLCDAMRYLMRKHDVRVTTQPKSALLNNLSNI